MVNAGQTLGPVGGRIVAETLIGLIRGNSRSYLNADPKFTPFLGSDLQLGSQINQQITGSHEYNQAHFFYYAGVVEPGIYR